MWYWFFSVLLLGGPVDLATSSLTALKGLDAPVKAESVKKHIHPEQGVRVDVAPEGSRQKRWKTWKRTDKTEVFRATLAPVFKAGIFKATPACRAENKTVVCSLMTATSMPREVVFAIEKGKAWMVEVRWAPEPEEPDLEDEDDELPM